MTTYEFDEIMAETFIKIKGLSQTKGKEYTQGGDRLKNFVETGEDLDIHPMKTCFIFMKKHWDSLRSFMKYGKTHSTESIESRIHDLILYLILLKAILKEYPIVKEGGQNEDS